MLDGILGLYLVPHGYLHLLPLHAARRQDERTDPRFLCDDFLISYLPSAALLPELPAPDWRGRVHSLANPEEGTRHTLPFSQWEGRQLQPRYPDARLHVGKTGTWGLGGEVRTTPRWCISAATARATPPSPRCRTSGWPTTYCWPTTCCTGRRRCGPGCSSSSTAARPAPTTCAPSMRAWA